MPPSLDASKLQYTVHAQAALLCGSRPWRHAAFCTAPWIPSTEVRATPPSLAAADERALGTYGVIWAELAPALFGPKDFFYFWEGVG